jgi:hypothetical protein
MMVGATLRAQASQRSDGIVASDECSCCRRARALRIAALWAYTSTICIVVSPCAQASPPQHAPAASARSYVCVRDDKEQRLSALCVHPHSTPYDHHANAKPATGVSTNATTMRLSTLKPEPTKIRPGTGHGRVFASEPHVAAGALRRQPCAPQRPSAAPPTLINIAVPVIREQVLALLTVVRLRASREAPPNASAPAVCLPMRTAQRTHPFVRSAVLV